MEQTWAAFVSAIERDSPASLALVNPPATDEQIEEARRELGSLHPDLERLYRLADGFTPGAYLLLDSHRILPLAELIDDSRSLNGTYIVTDSEAGEGRKLGQFDLLTLTRTRPDVPDMSRVSVSVSRKKARVHVWFVEGGVHDFEEVVDTEESLDQWLDDAISDYHG